MTPALATSTKRRAFVEGALASVLVAFGCARAQEATPAKSPPDPAPVGDAARTPGAPHGVFLIADTDAVHPGLEGADSLRGALLRFDPKTTACDVFVADADFREPQGIVVHPDGSLLVVDFGADPTGKSDANSRGCVFRLDGATGKRLRRYDHAGFRAPTSLVLLDAHTALVSDRAAEHASDPAASKSESGARAKGAVFVLDLESGDVKRAITDPRFRAPSCLATDPRGRAGFALLMDADAKLDPTSTSEGLLIELDTNDATDAIVKPLLATEGTISPLGLLALPDGGVLVFDTNADPMHLGGPAGAIFRAVFGAEEKSFELVASLPRFRDPVRGCVGPDHRVWFVDANADPDKRGPDAAGRGQNATGPGAIFALDLGTSAVETIASPQLFVNPVAIAWIP